jgi:hypothetical protein
MKTVKQKYARRDIIHEIDRLLEFVNDMENNSQWLDQLHEVSVVTDSPVLRFVENHAISDIQELRESLYHLYDLIRFGLEK